MSTSNRSLVVVAVVLLSLHDRLAVAQFSWDGECSTLWYDCCIVGKLYENNWATEGNPTTCPPLPGPTDTVSLSGLVDSGGGIITIAGMSQSGLFLCYSQGLSILNGDIFTTGTIAEPGRFQLNGLINLYDGATIDVGSFSTFDFRSGAIRDQGTAGQQFVINGFGTLTKTAEPTALTRLQVPFDNEGLISVEVGTLILDAGGSNNGTIEALGDAILYFEAGTFALDGEVRGDGLMHFHNGTANIAGDYHPINTLIGGYPAVVNFVEDTSVENLTLTSSGTIGGAGELTIDDLTWYGSSVIGPGGVITIDDTMIVHPFQGGPFLQRDMEVQGTATLLPNSTISMHQAELRTYNEFNLQGNTTINHQACCVPNSNLKNFGVLRKSAGGTSIISVGLSNVGGSIAVESGTLILDGQMATTGPVTVNAGATLECRNNQQSLFPEASITGDGKVIFNGGIDYLEGQYDVATTEIWATVQFQSDATTTTLNMINGTLAGDGDFTIAEDLNFAWGNSVMSGDGITRALGPVTMAYSGSLHRVLEIDNAGSGSGAGSPPSGILTVSPNTSGELRGNGTIDGNLHDFNGVAPGLPGQSPIGALNVTGNFTQFSIPPGVLKIDIAGAACDQLHVGGTATLSGSLQVSGAPSSGQSYTILTAGNIIGTFAQVNAPAGMTVQYTSTSVILHAAVVPCPADIAPSPNGDDSVNVSDLLAVINGWGACSAPCPPYCAADVDDNCQVNVTDLLAVINAWGPCP